MVGYALIGVTWIALSDQLVSSISDLTHQTILQTLKGALFVAATAVGLWLVMVARDRRLERGRRDLATSEERYRMLAERAHDVVYRYRYLPTPGFDYVSPSATALTGYTPEELQGDALISSLLLDDDYLKLQEWVAGDSDEPMVVRWRHRDGRILWTEHVVTRVRDANGTLVAFEGTARDVTARVAAESQGRLLGQLIDASPIGVVVIGGSEDGYRVRYANETLARLIGRPVEDLIGASGSDIAGAAGPVLADAEAARSDSGHPYGFDTVLGTAGGDTLPVSILVSPIYTSDGAIDSIMAMVSDRSEAIGRLSAESRLRAVLDASPVAVAATDLDGTVTTWNLAAERLFGWTADEVIGHRLPFLDDVGWAGTREQRDQLIAGTADPSVTWSVARKDGSMATCLLTTGIIRDATGRATGFMGVVEDLTEQRRQEDWNSLLRRAIDQAAEAIVMTDLAGTITYVNPAFARVSGYSEAELVGANPRVLKSGLTPPHVYTEMWARLMGGDTWRGMLTNRRKDGSFYEEEATLSPVVGASGAPIAYVGVKRDVTLERRLASGLSSELRDRAAVQEAMARIDLRDSPEETAQNVCLAMSGFEGVDEAVILYLPPGDGLVVPIGMAAGGKPASQPLEPLDSLLSEHYRRRAAEGPWAHSHLDADRTDPETARVWFEHQSYVAAPVHYRDRPVALLIAATDSLSPDAWIARHLRVVAELAVHAAPLIGPQLIERDAAVTYRREILQLLEGGEFVPVFQPVCDLASRAPIGWEALTRFGDGSQPARRFREAHTVGLGDRLELACALLAVETFDRLAKPGWLSINVSANLVLSGDASDIASSISGPVVLEITERVPIEDYASMRAAIERLDPLVMIAVDDAGAGYASLRNVLELRPDFIKLDLSFVHAIDRDPARQAMVAGMVHYASETNTQLIAEGVQTEAERRTLLRLGVRYGQGFLLGVPSPEGEVVPGAPDAGRRRRQRPGLGASEETWTGADVDPEPGPSAASIGALAQGRPSASPTRPTGRVISED